MKFICPSMTDEKYCMSIFISCCSLKRLFHQCLAVGKRFGLMGLIIPLQKTMLRNAQILILRARCVVHNVVICMQRGQQEFIIRSGKHRRWSPDNLPRWLVQMCLTRYQEPIIIHSALIYTRIQV